MDGRRGVVVKRLDIALTIYFDEGCIDGSRAGQVDDSGVIRLLPDLSADSLHTGQGCALLNKVCAHL